MKRGLAILALFFAASASAAPPCPIDPSVRSALVGAYKPRFTGCTLTVWFPKCGPPTQPTRVAWVTGNGHSLGTSLTLAVLERAGATWTATRLSILPGKGSAAPWAGEKSAGVIVHRDAATTSASAAVRFAETALEAQLFENKPKPKPGVGYGGGFSSSHDFVVAIAIVSTSPLERAWAGYEGSDGQLEYLPLVASKERLEAALPDPMKLSTFDADARAIFVTRFHALAPKLDDKRWWFVREALVRAAGDAGDKSLVPKLRAWIAQPAGDVAFERLRVVAVTALAQLTGDDRRFTQAGKERPVVDVVSDYTSKPPKI